VAQNFIYLEKNLPQYLRGIDSNSSFELDLFQLFEKWLLAPNLVQKFIAKKRSIGSWDTKRSMCKFPTFKQGRYTIWETSDSTGNRETADIWLSIFTNTGVVNVSSWDSADISSGCTTNLITRRDFLFAIPSFSHCSQLQNVEISMQNIIKWWSVNTPGTWLI